MKKYFFFSGMRTDILILVFTGLTGFCAFSQEKSLKIIDEMTGLPIADVHFKYGSKTGFSNEKGEISIEFSNEISLLLSHIRYGQTEIIPPVLKEAFEDGRLKLQLNENVLMPVTVIKVHQSAGEKSRIEIDSKDKLEHDAGQLLDQIPAISAIRKSGAYGFDPVLRGFKYDQLNLVIDGVQTASAACPNRMDPASSQIPVNMVSEIEILKGPHSFRYGNVFGGTINFKSTELRFTGELNPLGRVGTSYETNGNIFRTEGVGGFSSKRTEFSVFGSWSQGNDYTDGVDSLVQADFNRLNWGGKFGLKLSDKQKLGLLVSNNSAHDVDFITLPMDLREDNTWLVNANHSAVFYNTKLSSLKTAFYYTEVNHLMDNLTKNLSPRTVDAVSDASTLNYGGRSELRFDFKTGPFFTGIDYRFESADGFRTRNILMGPIAGKTLIDNIWQDAQIQRGGVFGEMHLAKGGFDFAFSGRLDFNKAVANNPEAAFLTLYPDVTSEYVNPSVSAGGTKTLGQKVSLGIWLGSAQRSPGISERYINFFPVGIDPYEMIGNPQLKPETNNQADIVFKYQSPVTLVNFNFYSSFLQNYISSEIDINLKPRMSTSPGVRRYINIDKAMIFGFEASWEQQLFSFLKHDFQLVYTNGTDQKLDEPLPEIPPFELNYNLEGIFANGKVLPEIQFRQAFRQDRISESFAETKSPAFNVVNLKCSWLVTRVISFGGGIQNLFDTAYYEHLSRKTQDKRPVYSPGRSFYVTLTFNFI